MQSGQTTVVSQDKAAFSSVLHSLVESDRIGILRTYLAKGIPTDYQDAKGDTALHLAARKGDVGMVRLLLAHNASRSTKNNKSHTPITTAALAKHWDCVFAFTEYPDENNEAEYGAALLDAVEANNISCAEALLKAGATTTWCKTKTNGVAVADSLLHLATIKNNPAMIALLILYKADTLKINKDNLIPASLAVKFAKECKDLESELAGERRWRCVELFALSAQDPEIEMHYIKNRLVMEIDSYLEKPTPLFAHDHKKRAIGFKQDCLEQTDMTSLAELVKVQMGYLTQSGLDKLTQNSSAITQPVEQKKRAHQIPSVSCFYDDYVAIVEKYNKQLNRLAPQFAVNSVHRYGVPHNALALDAAPMMSLAGPSQLAGIMPVREKDAPIMLPSAPPSVDAPIYQALAPEMDLSTSSTPLLRYPVLSQVDSVSPLPVPAKNHTNANVSLLSAKDLASVQHLGAKSFLSQANRGAVQNELVSENNQEQQHSAVKLSKSSGSAGRRVVVFAS
jgi:ankyrin repeat protein